jgi:hypothetical protein
MVSRVGCGGAAAPNRLFGEGCLSGASSLAILFGTEAEEPGGPRTGENGFGSFCRNKRASSAGAKPRIIILKLIHLAYSTIRIEGK